MKSKKQLRASLRKTRKNLTRREQLAAAKRLAHTIATSPIFQRARHIAFYSAADGEISLTPLLMIANKHRKKCYFPVVAGNNMAFFRLKAKHKLSVKNRFNIKEPLPRAAPFAAEQLNLVLLPLVGFDASGNRLGMGGGYYDKTFAFCRQRSRRPVLMGVAHQCQEVSELSPEAWDIPLDFIATDKTKIRC